MQRLIAKRNSMAGLAAVRRRRLRHIMAGYGNYMIAAAVFVAGVVAVSILAEVFASKGPAVVADQPEAVEIAATEEIAEAGSSIDDTYPFNTMSRDWGAEDLVGFRAYQIPQDYEAGGGCFPDIMQKYTYIVCTQNGVDYATVLALIEVESGYKWNAAASGAAGYMQVMRKWHKDRMDKLNCYDLLNPYQNVSVGVDYLAELLEKYNGSYEKALTAYQCGASGAYKYWFSAGVNTSPYARNVLEIAARIEAEMGVGADGED